MDLIKDWMQFIRNTRNDLPVIFLSDYDMHISENLVQGVDVWINTPRRPWEACGTSGMKILVNGGLNLSVLDGWWAEAFTPELGWALGDGNEHGDDPDWDAVEAEQLYNILEKQVVPEFYKRNTQGIPELWIARMRESMAQLTPRFSADRAVREYTEQHYLPASAAFINRSANKGAAGLKISEWKQALDQKWPKIRFGEVKVDTDTIQHVFEVQVWLNEIDPEAVKVELFANEQSGFKGTKQEMNCLRQLTGTSDGYLYTGTVPANRPVEDYTPRVIPYYLDVAIPLEANQILWQH
jgi:starch phosphorylase